MYRACDAPCDLSPYLRAVASAVSLIAPGGRDAASRWEGFYQSVFDLGKQIGFTINCAALRVR